MRIDAADGTELAVHLLDGETLLGTARRTTAPDLTVPAPVDLEAARAAAPGVDVLIAASSRTVGQCQEYST